MRIAVALGGSMAGLSPKTTAPASVIHVALFRLRASAAPPTLPPTDNRRYTNKGWLIVRAAGGRTGGRKQDGRGGDAPVGNGDEIRPFAHDGRRISRTAARRARGLYLRRTSRGRHDAPRFSQHRPYDRAPL